MLALFSIAQWGQHSWLITIKLTSCSQNIKWTSFADRGFFVETGEASFTAAGLCLDPVVGISLAWPSGMLSRIQGLSRPVYLLSLHSTVYIKLETLSQHQTSSTVCFCHQNTVSRAFYSTVTLNFDLWSLNLIHSSVPQCIATVSFCENLSITFPDTMLTMFQHAQMDEGKHKHNIK